MMEDKNYYLNTQIGQSGVASTKNPIYLPDDYNPFETNSARPRAVGHITSPTNNDYKYIDVEDLFRNEDLTVENLLAEQQTTAEKLGNALINNLVIAGTTAVGIVGTVLGGIQAAIENDFSKVWDNSVNNALVDIQNYTSEKLGNYREAGYDDKSIWGKMGTSTFWADIVKNLGYVEGMAIPGGIVSKGLSKAPKLVQGLGATFVGSLGEASTEAVHKKQEDVAQDIANATESYKEKINAAQSQEEINSLYNDYLNTLDIIDQDATTAGNFIYGSNIALLNVTGNLQFFKMFTRGADTAKKAAINIVKNRAQKSSLAWDLTKAGLGKIKDSTAEGLEEVTQDLLTKIPDNYLEYNKFNKSQFNSEKRALVADFWQSVGQSLSDTFRDSRTAEEFASGFIIGALGVPTLKKGGFPLKLEGNAIGEFREAYKENLRKQELVNKINNRLQTDKQLNAFYNGIVRHLAIQDNKNIAALNNDDFEFQNSEYAQFLSDVMMFDSAGHLKYLKNLIKNSVDLSDESIQSLIEETTKDGKGPFTQNGNSLSIEEVRDIIQKKQKSLQKNLDSYVKTKETYQRQNPLLQEETLNELVYLKEQSENLLKRHSTMFSEIVEDINKSIDKLKQISPETFKNIKDIQITTETLPELLKDPIFKKVIKSLEIHDLTAYTTISKKLEDSNKAVLAYNNLSKKIKETLTNPEKAKKEDEKVKTEVEQEFKTKKAEKLKTKLKEATSVQEISKILANEEDEESIEEVKKDVSNIPLLKTKLDIDAYNEDLKERLLKKQDIEKPIKAEALSYLTQITDKASSLEDITEMSLGSIENGEVKQLLSEILSEQKKDTNFKNKMVSSYTVPPKQTGTPNNNNPSKGETGNSETGTVPTNSGNPSTTAATELPLSEPTIENIIEENKNINNDNSSLASKKKGGNYYRPAIPELHIDASNQGDFRPFNEVVKETEGKDFDKIYNYLAQANAFEYVNSGKLKPSDTLYFMIDENFESTIKEESWYTEPTIFLVKKEGDSYQVVGSLDGTSSAKFFEGLTEVRKQVLEEYNNKTSSSENFISTLNIKVNKIMIGKVPYDTTERSLKDIPNIKNCTIAIMQNGVLTSNGKIPNDKIIPLKDISNKEGRIYILVPTGTGMYLPMAARVKSPKDFNLQEEITKDKVFFKQIDNVINQICEATSAEDVDNIINTLKQYFYIDTNKGTRTIHIDWYQDSTGESGLKIIKVKRDSLGNILLDDKGHRVEESTQFVPFTGASLMTLNDDGSITEESVTTSIEKRKETLIKTLSHLKVPFQINLGELNSEGYLNMLIESDILTSNITEGNIKGNWFVTNYISNNKEMPAEPPQSRSMSPTSIPKNTSEPFNTTIPGTPITVHGTQYFVQLDKLTVLDKNGRDIVNPNTKKLILALTWATQKYGNIKEGLTIFNYQTIIPQGRGLDIKNQKFLSEEQTASLKQALKRRENIQQTIKEFKEQINTNQERVNKLKTDSTSYYITEEDGQEYAYSRVHTIIGNNSTSTEEIGPKQKEALEAGSSVDIVVRDFFNTGNPEKPSNMSQQAYDNLLNSLQKIKKQIDINGETFLANNLVVYHKYQNGARVAGELDILSMDMDGNLKIYDVKTSKYSFHQINTALGPRNFFTEKASWQKMSTQDYYTLQLSAYKNIFESQYPAWNIQNLAILPFKLDRTGSNINNLTQESGIKLEFNPKVSVPLERNNVTSQEISPSTPLELGLTMSMINEEDEEFLSEVKDIPYILWDQKQEETWLKKVLPNLATEQRYKIQKGLIEVAKKGTKAWGKFSQAMITISDIAKEGTVYHEAFHAVFHLFLSQQEREALYKEAIKKYGQNSNEKLEENMAESFREYILDRQTTSVLGKIKNFFQDLWITIINWKRLQPHLYAYYQRINKGKFSEYIVIDNLNSDNLYSTEEYTPEMQAIKDEAIKNGTFMKAPNGKPSKLDERQWLHVRTKAFKRWFGDWTKITKNEDGTWNIPDDVSKVIDIETGEPLVVYHHSNTSGFNTFNLDKSTKTREQLFSYAYHAGTKDAAEEVYTYGSKDASMFELFLNIKYPIELTDSTQGQAIRTLSNFAGQFAERNYGKKLPEEVYTKYRDKISMDNSPEGVRIAMKEVFDYMGFDGYYYINEVEDVGSISWAALDPNQIKSATDNIGTYSEDNDDIRYAEIPKEISTELDEAYERAKKKVKQFNKSFYMTEKEALNAVKQLFLPDGLFKGVVPSYRTVNIGGKEVQELRGYKAVLLNKEEFEAYKKSLQEKYLQQEELKEINFNKQSMKDLLIYYKSLQFDNLSHELQEALFNKGWSKAKFDSMTPQEKEIIIDCIGV